MADTKIPTVPPSEVLHFYRAIQNGEISQSEFMDVWNRSIEDAVRMVQEQDKQTVASRPGAAERRG